MPVEPHLRRIREVGADLDEPRAELRVEHVEVVDAHPPLGLVELEPDARPRLLLKLVAAAEHPLELLRRDDRDDPEAALPLGPLQVRPHVVELAVVPPRPIRLTLPIPRSSNARAGSAGPTVPTTGGDRGEGNPSHAKGSAHNGFIRPGLVPACLAVVRCGTSSAHGHGAAPRAVPAPARRVETG